MKNLSPDDISQADVEVLRTQVAELQRTLSAIRQGGVDAVLVGEPGSEKVYSLSTADRPYKIIVDTMRQGALTVSARHVVLYANHSFAQMMGCEASSLVGTLMTSHVTPDGVEALEEVLDGASDEPVWRDVDLATSRGNLSVTIVSTFLDLESVAVRCVIVTDRSAQVVTERDLANEIFAGTAQLMAANDRLAQSNRTLRMISKGDEALVRAPDEASLAQSICDAIVDSGEYPLAWVGRGLHDERGSVERLGAAGDTTYLDEVEVTWASDEYGSNPLGLTLRDRTVHVVPDFQVEQSFAPWRRAAAAHGLRSACVLPVTARAELPSALAIYSSKPNAFDDLSLSLLTGLAENLSYGLLRLQDAAQLRNSFDATIATLAAAGELRDPYTAGHQRRVAQLAGSICSHLGIDPETSRGIVIAATVHDIGKLMVPAEILSLPGRLSESQMALVRDHSRAGHDLLATIDFPWPVATMVLQHHERQDGSGYPQGLVGDEILVGSAVLAVADVVEAMSSHRPYRAGLGLDAALREIEKNQGLLYDTEVADACLLLCRRPDFVYHVRASEPLFTFA